MARFCGFCGAPIDENASVCGNCGKPVDGEETKGGGRKKVNVKERKMMTEDKV